jgi:hypothetical protein
MILLLQLLQLLLFLPSLRLSPESPEICVTPPEISPFLIQRLPVSDPRSFSDSSSYILLFVMLFLAVSVSNLAIAVAAAIRKSLVGVGTLAFAKPVR